MLELANNSESAHGGGADAQDRIGDDAGKCIAGLHRPPTLGRPSRPSRGLATPSSVSAATTAGVACDDRVGLRVSGPIGGESGPAVYLLGCPS